MHMQLSSEAKSLVLLSDTSSTPTLAPIDIWAFTYSLAMSPFSQTSDSMTVLI